MAQKNRKVGMILQHQSGISNDVN